MPGDELCHICGRLCRCATSKIVEVVDAKAHRVLRERCARLQRENVRLRRRLREAGLPFGSGEVEGAT